MRNARYRLIFEPSISPRKSWSTLNAIRDNDITKSNIFKELGMSANYLRQLESEFTSLLKPDETIAALGIF